MLYYLLFTIIIIIKAFGALAKGAPGEGGDGQEGPERGGAAGHDRGVHLRQVHAVELRRLRYQGHDGRRRRRAAEPRGLRQARRPQGRQYDII